MEYDQDSYDDLRPGDKDYTPYETKSSSWKFIQNELNDLIKIMSISKEKSKLLASRLQQKNLL